jgi:hypothetical protein
MKALYYACSVKSSFLFHGFSELSNFSELSKMNQDTPNGHESPVGADLSRPPPIYRPKGGSEILGLIGSSSLSAKRETYHVSRPFC